MTFVTSSLVIAEARDGLQPLDLLVAVEPLETAHADRVAEDRAPRPCGLARRRVVAALRGHGVRERVPVPAAARRRGRPTRSP